MEFLTLIAFYSNFPISELIWRNFCDKFVRESKLFFTMKNRKCHSISRKFRTFVISVIYSVFSRVDFFVVWRFSNSISGFFRILTIACFIFLISTTSTWKRFCWNMWFYEIFRKITSSTSVCFAFLDLFCASTWKNFKLVSRKFFKIIS